MSSSLRAHAASWMSFVLAVLTFGLAIRTNLTSERLDLQLTGLSFLLALLFGVFAKIEARRVGGALAGRTPVGLLVAVLALLPVLVGAAESVRWATVRISGLNNLKAIGQAMHAYEKEHGRLPPASLRDPKGRPLLSWRVLLLPYLEQKELYRRFHRDEPWDSQHNKPLLQRMPRLYAPMPGNPSAEPNTAFYRVFVGKGTVFEGKGLTRKQIDRADGCANTILVVEAAESVPWTKPGGLPYAPDQPLAPLGDFYKKEYYVNPRGRFLALFADGSVRGFFHDTPERLLRPLLTWNGGEDVDKPEP